MRMLAIESACIISHNSNVISFHRDDMSNCKLISISVLGRHGSASLCRVERENKMAATYNVLAFKR